MRLLSVLLLAILAVTPLAAGTKSRTHITDTHADLEFTIVRESDGDHWAELERGRVHYRTTNPMVLAQLEKVLEAHATHSKEHSRLGRLHSELGREHAALSREHARLGREHSRAARSGSTAEIERRQRELETEQRALEAKQRKLEDRQRDLESEQRQVEAKQRSTEGNKQRELEAIFERAAREGKATRK